MKLIPISFILTICFTSLSAQVPQRIQNEFQRIQPGSKFVEWRKEKGDRFRVTYTNWYRQSLVFDANAEIVISQSELPSDYVPKSIELFIEEKLQPEKCVVWDSFDENNERSYFVVFKEEKIFYFDSQGQFAGEAQPEKSWKRGLLSSISIN